MRGATRKLYAAGAGTQISIHAPRERSDNSFLRDNPTFIISIHAPRERSDNVDLKLFLEHYISIHAPRERSDPQSTGGRL